MKKIIKIGFIAIISLLLITNIMLFKGKNYWYNSENYHSIEGKIIEVKNNKIHIESESKEYIINHTNKYEYKIGEKVIVLYDGFIMDSDPQQIDAVSILVK